jgi:hypothetical protein
MLLRIIRAHFFFQLILSLVIFLAGTFAILAQTKNPTPSPSPSREQPEEEVPAEDKVYSAKEVDVKARVIHPLENQPKPGPIAEVG